MSELGEQLKAIKETQSAEVHDLKEQVRIRGERMERMFRNLPLKLQDYLKAMGEFDDNGKVL